MRLIDVDELIKCIPSEEYNSRFAVMNAPTVEPSKWIPCSEELPKNGTSVLFCDDEGDIYNGYCLVKDGGRYPKQKEYYNDDG